VASAPIDAESLAQTIREADSRMYQDKMADRRAAGSVQ
jgi:hypothetical protein